MGDSGAGPSSQPGANANIHTDHGSKAKSDTSHLLDTMRNVFLACDKPSSMLDVGIKCSDGKVLYANKANLSASSPTFKSLFEEMETEEKQLLPSDHPSVLHTHTLRNMLASTFVNWLSGPNTSTGAGMRSPNPSTQPSIIKSVPISSETLREVLSFICIGEVPLFDSLRKDFNKSKPAILKTVESVVQVAVAASYLHMPHLQKQASDSLTNIFHSHSCVACRVLDAMCIYRGNALKDSSPTVLWKIALKEQNMYFGTGEKSGLQIPYQKPGILDLSYESFSYLLEGISNIGRDAGEELFSYLYMWDTEGNELPMRGQGKPRFEKVHAPNGYENSRWEEACKMSTCFNVKEFKPAFLFNRVEGSDLVKPSVLFETYRNYAMEMSDNLETYKEVLLCELNDTRNNLDSTSKEYANAKKKVGAMVKDVSCLRAQVENLQKDRDELRLLKQSLRSDGCSNSNGLKRYAFYCKKEIDLSKPISKESIVQKGTSCEYDYYD